MHIFLSIKNKFRYLRDFIYKRNTETKTASNSCKYKKNLNLSNPYQQHHNMHMYNAYLFGYIYI